MIPDFRVEENEELKETLETQNSKKVHRPGLKFPNTFACL